jgi:hypothetical protein
LASVDAKSLSLILWNIWSFGYISCMMGHLAYALYPGLFISVNIVGIETKYEPSSLYLIVVESG